MIHVIDNFCDEEYFKKLEELMVHSSHEFPWFYHDNVNGKGYEGEEEGLGIYQFVHPFYPGKRVLHKGLEGTRPMIQENPFMNSLMPIVEALNSETLLRVKANRVARTDKIIEHGLHLDFVEKGNEILTTAILYMNTNDGYTHFEDGTKIESVANRMVVFPCNLFHGGTTCTDQNTRVVINFNFLKRKVDAL